MKISKKILVTTATCETLFIRRSRYQTNMRFFCEECSTTVEMIDLNSAVTIFKTTTRELLQGIETGAVHSVEIQSGHLFVCASSLHTVGKQTKNLSSKEE